MAFWGVEVKPGKPYVHQLDETRGRLHISQATLGVGASEKKSLLQCNVGDKSPILACCLFPEKTESCPLDMEFEEDDDVVFSVLGPRSVHLIGYYLGSSTCSHGDGDESDSYGEDIGESENEQSTDFDSEDEYEDDFIDDDDDDIEMFSASPRPKSGVVIEEILDDENLVNENGGRKRLKSKFQVSDDSDDSNQKQITVGGASITIESESEDEDGFPVSSPFAEVQGKPDKKVSKRSKRKAEDDGDQVMPISCPSKTEVENAEVQEKPDKKVSKKSNKKSENGGDRVTGSKRKSQDGQDGKAERVIEKTKDSSLPTSEIEQESTVQQKKKKRKERVKEGKTHGVANDSMVEADKATDDITQDEPAENTKPSNDKCVEINADEDTTGKKKKKKNKNKKNKTPESNKNADGEETNKGSVVQIEDKKAEVKPTQERSYANGLVVEELQMGKPDGKRASPGTKVSVRYIGKLKKNGKIFDSNINRAPFQFRLGVGEVIKGWDVGVSGMRVGDKRKLTIPPSMGYGQQGAGQKIPPNAWLEFDVELLGVR